MSTSNPPLACSLSAADLRLREREIAAFFAIAEAARELPDGYAFGFPAGEQLANDALTFILAERACCPFFTFELTFPSPHQQMWLAIRGRDGVKEIVHGIVETALPATIAVE